MTLFTFHTSINTTATLPNNSGSILPSLSASLDLSLEVGGGGDFHHLDKFLTTKRQAAIIT